MADFNETKIIKPKEFTEINYKRYTSQMKYGLTTFWLISAIDSIVTSQIIYMIYTTME